MLKRADRHGALNFSFAAGLLVGLTPWGCATLSFPYHFYNPEPVSYVGKLLGPTPADDLDFMACAPDAHSLGKCVCLLSPEWEKLKLNYLDLEQQLIDCQAKLR